MFRDMREGAALCTLNQTLPTRRGGSFQLRSRPLIVHPHVSRGTLLPSSSPISRLAGGVGRAERRASDFHPRVPPSLPRQISILLEASDAAQPRPDPGPSSASSPDPEAAAAGRTRAGDRPTRSSSTCCACVMPSIIEPVPSKSDDHEVVVAENVKMVDIQDKEVTMKGICSVAAYDQWTPLSVSGQPPKPRYKHGAAVVQEKMYVFGGNHNGRYLDDVQVLDFKSLSWSKLEAKIQPGPSAPAEAVVVAPCAGHSLIPSGNKILSLAGHTREPTESLSVKEFDPQICTWSTLRTYGRSPSSRGGQSVTRIGDTLVVFGGEGDGRSLLNDLHILDLETMTWDEFESTGTPPSPRSEHAAACYADRYLLIFGGGSHSTCFSDLHLLDMETMEWSRPEQHGITPEPRAGHAGITLGDYWFITGGGNSKKGVPETLVLNMSTLEWSVLTSLEGRAPPTSEGSSLVLHTINGEDFLLSFGGYSGRYSNEVYALKTSFRPSVSSNSMTPLSAEANSSRGPIFEIEELQDKKNNKGGDTSKTLMQAVKHEKNQLEEKLEREKIQSFHLKKELADVENKNVELTQELNSVRDQLLDEAARASKLENEVSEIQQRLQKMVALEKDFELLRSERDGSSDKSASGSNKKPGGVGFRRWYGDEP